MLTHKENELLDRSIDLFETTSKIFSRCSESSFEKSFAKEIEDSFNEDCFDKSSNWYNVFRGLVRNKASGCNLKLSEGVSNTQTTLGINTFDILSMIIIAAGSNLDQKNYILRKLYPSMNTESYQTIFNRISGATGVLGAQAGLSSPNAARNPINSSTQSTHVNAYQDIVAYSPESIIYKRDLLNNSERGIAQYLGYETMYGMIRAETTINLALTDAVARGYYTYGTENLQVISSGLLTSNVYTLSQPIGTFQKSSGAISPNNDINPLVELTNIAILSKALPFSNNNITLIVTPQVYTCITENVNSQAFIKQEIITREVKEIKDSFTRLSGVYLPSGINLLLATDDRSYTTLDVDSTEQVSASNAFLLNGSLTPANNNMFANATNINFNGIVHFDTSLHGSAAAAGVVFGPHIQAGYMDTSKTGYGVRIFDRTAVDPTNPSINIISYASFGIATFQPQAMLMVNFNMNIV